MANSSETILWQRRSSFLPGFRHQYNKVRSGEGRGQGWLVETRVIYCFFNTKLNRCALYASYAHQLSRLSRISLSVFVLAIPSAQSMRPSLHSVSLTVLRFPGGFYLVSPRQLLQSDTGAPHFALDPLTYRCLLSPSPTADFAEPRPPRHSKQTHESGIWTTSLKQTVQKNQFAENNQISLFVWGSRLQEIML